MSQEQIKRNHESNVDKHTDEVAQGLGAVAVKKESPLDQEVDSILDEIDSVLEENAEEFVRSFVQKGGQ